MLTRTCRSHTNAPVDIHHRHHETLTAISAVYSEPKEHQSTATCIFPGNSRRLVNAQLADDARFTSVLH